MLPVGPITIGLHRRMRRRIGRRERLAALGRNLVNRHPRRIRLLLPVSIFNATRHIAPPYLIPLPDKSAARTNSATASQPRCSRTGGLGQGAATPTAANMAQANESAIRMR